MNTLVTLSDIPVTQELVQHLFNYDSNTGKITWKNPPVMKGIKGKDACSINNNYHTVNIYGKNYNAHRVIWLYVHGYFPENDIDHIDRDKTNNKLENLREVSRQCNMRNVGKRVNNKSNVVGVSFIQKRIKWYANIMVNGKTYGLGEHCDYIEAVCTRLAAEQCLGWPDCDTKSTAYQCIKTWLNN
jgi:mRNA-degrading endonuclease HigB of HigAB toxin-antitoxin module